jgi:anti-sigma-K factor RskA
MLLYVTDGLEPSERQDLAAHLAGGCPACAGALVEAQATVAHLPLALPQATPPRSARDKLFSRVAAEVSSGGARQGRPWFSTALAACIGAILAGGAMWVALRPRVAPSPGPGDVQLVSMKGADPQPEARGRIFWDRARNEWIVHVTDMKSPPAGRTYELWFITPQQKKVPAGTFDVDARGRGTLVASVPPNIGPIALAAVTDEPIGGVPQPTGSIQLVGEIK